MFCLLSFASIAGRSQCARDAAGRLADEHALIAAYVSRLQSGARLVLGEPSRSGDGDRNAASPREGCSRQRYLASAGKQREMDRYSPKSSENAQIRTHAPAGKGRICVHSHPVAVTALQNPSRELINVVPNGSDDDFSLRDHSPLSPVAN